MTCYAYEVACRILNSCLIKSISSSWLEITIYQDYPQLLLSTIRNQFWFTSSRNLSSSKNCSSMTSMHFVLHNSPKPTSPVKGNLLKSRILAIFPFSVIRTYYAGPLSIKTNNIRIFICFSTKALVLHILGVYESQA